MDDDYFEQYIKALDDKYLYDPVEAVDDAEYLLNRLESKKLPKLDDDSIDILLVVIGLIANALVGLINFEPFYYMGFIFFVAGLLVAMYAGKMGIIFLFAHGLIGFMMMNGPTLFNTSVSGVLSDGPTLSHPYFAVTILVTCAAFLLTILNAFVKPISEKKHVKPFIVFLFLLANLLIKLLPIKLGL